MNHVYIQDTKKHTSIKDLFNGQFADKQGCNQVWTLRDEVDLYQTLLINDTMNFQLLENKFESRTRKQAENKWQNIKRKHDSGIKEWKTIMYYAVRKYFLEYNSDKMINKQLQNILASISNSNHKKQDLMQNLQLQIDQLFGLNLKTEADTKHNSYSLSNSSASADTDQLLQQLFNLLNVTI